MAAAVEQSATSRDKRATWIVRRAPELFAALILAGQTALLAKPLGFLYGRTVSDDTFYTLEVAYRAAREGMVSFDGIHLTNGVQFGWFAICWVLALFFEDKDTLFRAAMGASFLLNCCASWLLFRFLRRAWGLAGLLAGAPIVFFTMLVADAPFLKVLDSSLQLTVLSAFLLFAITRLDGGFQRDRCGHDYHALVFMFAAFFLVRTDALLAVAPLAGVVVWTLWRAGGRPAGWLLKNTLPWVAAGVLFLAVNQFVFGSALPISGIAKSNLVALERQATEFGLWFDLAHVPVLVLVLAQKALAPVFGVLHLLGVGVPEAAVIPFGTAVKSGWPGVLVGLAVAAPLAVSIFSWRDRFKIGDRMLRLLVAGSVLHVTAMAVVVGRFVFAATWWYWTTEFVVIATCFGAAGTRVAGWLRLRPNGLTRAVSVILVGAIGLVCAVSLQRGPVDEDGWLQTRHRAALWVADNVPARATIGAWNAGQMGYWSERKVVNLDGLVNTREFADGLRAGLDLDDYFAEKGISYVVDYNFWDPSMVRGFQWEKALRFRGVMEWSELEVAAQFWIDGRRNAAIFVARIRASSEEWVAK
jgi:hypothetical protein